VKTVLFYLSDFQSGGTEWFAVRLARAMKKKNIKPIFLVTQKKGELIKLIQSEFDTTILNGKKYCLCSLLLTIPDTIKFINNKKPDAIISGLPLLNFTMSLAIRFSKHKLCFIVVEHLRIRNDGNIFYKIKQKLKQKLSCIAHHMATHVVCVSKIVLNDINCCTGLCCKVRNKEMIYNPIIPDDIEDLKKQQIYHRWFENKKTPVILAIGRLLPVKDFTTLIRAFKEVINVKPVKLIILGEGVELLKLEKLIEDLNIQDHISMPGTVRNVFPYLKSADLFVLSSKREAFGNVIVEALSCGTFVVSTDCGGPKEILENENLGLLVPPSDPNKMKDAILKALDTKHDKQILTNRGKDFSVEKSVNAYIKLLEK